MASLELQPWLSKVVFQQTVDLRQSLLSPGEQTDICCPAFGPETTEQTEAGSCWATHSLNTTSDVTRSICAGPDFQRVREESAYFLSFFIYIYSSQKKSWKRALGQQINYIIHGRTEYIIKIKYIMCAWKNHKKTLNNLRKYIQKISE